MPLTKNKRRNRWNNLRNAVRMCHYFDNVVQRQQRVTLNLRVHVLALGAQSQQLDQVDVVHQRTCRVEAITLRPHQFQQRLEREAIVVEDQHLFTDVDQLRIKQTTLSDIRWHNAFAL